MMAAIAILAFVALAVIMALVSIQQAWLKQKSGIELFNNARWAMESMVNEIRRGCNYTVYATVGVDGLRFRSPLVADTEYIFYWRGDGTTYGNNDAIFRGVGADLSSANSSSSRKEVVNLVANTSSVFSVSDNNLVAIELTVRKGSRSCVLKSKALPRNRDPYTKLLIHADESNGSTSLADSSSRNYTITSVGGASTTNTQNKFGGLSAAFNGSGGYLSVGDDADWVLGDTFTVDTWVRFSSVTSNVWIVGQGGAASTNFWALSYSVNTLDFAVSVSNVTTIYISRSWTPAAGTWYHVAVVDKGGTWKLFVDGTQLGVDGSDADAVPDFSSALLFIGAGTNGTDNYLNGHIDELRISKGIARWTSNFTRPSMDYQS